MSECSTYNASLCPSWPPICRPRRTFANCDGTAGTDAACGHRAILGCFIINVSKLQPECLFSTAFAHCTFDGRSRLSRATCIFYGVDRVWLHSSRMCTRVNNKKIGTRKSTPNTSKSPTGVCFETAKVQSVRKAPNGPPLTLRNQLQLYDILCLEMFKFQAIAD